MYDHKLIGIVISSVDALIDALSFFFNLSRHSIDILLWLNISRFFSDASISTAPQADEKRDAVHDDLGAQKYDVDLGSVL